MTTEILSREWLHCLATNTEGAPLGYFRLVSGDNLPKLEIRTDGDNVRVSIPGAWLSAGGDVTYDFDSLVLCPDGSVVLRYGDGGDIQTAVIR
jgi:hypothetical protein